MGRLSGDAFWLDEHFEDRRPVGRRDAPSHRWQCRSSRAVVSHNRRMVIDWLLLALGSVGFIYLLANAEALAGRPRRPSRRTWRIFSLAPLAIAVGALINLIA